MYIIPNQLGKIATIVFDHGLWLSFVKHNKQVAKKSLILIYPHLKLADLIYEHHAFNLLNYPIFHAFPPPSQPS